MADVLRSHLERVSIIAAADVSSLLCSVHTSLPLPSPSSSVWRGLVVEEMLNEFRSSFITASCSSSEGVIFTELPQYRVAEKTRFALSGQFRHPMRFTTFRLDAGTKHTTASARTPQKGLLRSWRSMNT
ncbi:hypothetical protein TcCL_ESM05807 [Trypanosoma cruzi]|nr:hypothetical protein TcCL_ESM05807 [Trypanosoma cruzi]